MTWPAAVLLVVACGVVALWWLCRYLARQDADEAHRNLARLVAAVGATHASPLRERAMTDTTDRAARRCRSAAALRDRPAQPGSYRGIAP